MDSKQHVVLSSLLYADIFQYPLTEDEIWHLLPPQHLFTRSELPRILSSLHTITQKEGEYYSLKERKNLSKKRKIREVFSKQKIQEGIDVARWLSLIPSVLLIGISGSVASFNAEKHDDIDFFVITKKGTLFSTRLLLLVLLELLGKRRKRSEKKAPNKICLNFLVDERSMSFLHRADLYTAQELYHFLPLFERDATYTKLLRKNTWISSFLPHSKEVFAEKKFLVRKRSTTSRTHLGQRILGILEIVLRPAQLLLIKRHLKSETVSHSLLAFHPHDYRQETLSRFKKLKNNYSC